jgi:hypothetical protein
MIRLSQPGPQYLVFLERYAWDIEARWRMVERKKKELEEKAEAIGESDGDQWDWEFMVGKYCVERFVRDAERVMRYTGAIDPPSDDEVDEFSSSSSKEMKRGLLRKKVCRRNTPPPAKNSAGNFSGSEMREKGKQKSGTKVRMMFGEIEKGELKIEKETWFKGLLWYARPHVTVSTSTTRTPIEEFDIPIEHSGKVCVPAETSFRHRFDNSSIVHEEYEVVQEIHPHAAQEGPRSHRSDILEIQMPLPALLAKARCMISNCRYLGLKLYLDIHHYNTHSVNSEIFLT